MKNLKSLHRSTTILLAILTRTTARTWRNVDIPAIDAVIENDPLLGSSSQLAMEDISFLYGSVKTDDGTNNVPVTYSTPTPSINEPSSYIFTDAPSASIQPSTLIEKVAPNSNVGDSNVPTWSPSARYEATNGGCGADEILHRLVMYEFTGSSMTIKETDSSYVVLDHKSGTVNETNSTVGPTSNTEYLCLKKATCYTAEFSNVTSGMTWELHQVVMATGVGTILVASGTDDESGCQFGLEGSCATSCLGKCFTADVTPYIRCSIV